MSDAWSRVPPTLAGERVTLVPLTAAHEEPLYAAAADPRIWDWLPVRANESRTVFQRWLEEALEEVRAGVSLPFAILLPDGRPIGSTRYMRLAPADRRLEIGWTWLAPSAWRTGANLEAKLLLLTHAFEVMGCLRVELQTDVLNTRSREAIEGIGGRLEGVFLKHRIVRDGRRRDTALYAIIDDDWPALKRALRARLRPE